jgi:predicted transcriptional regulator
MEKGKKPIPRSANAIRADLIAYMERLNVTQIQLSECSGVDQGLISRIIRGKVKSVSKATKKLCN